jgi:inosose dehydratase
VIKVAGAPVSFGVFELSPEEGVDLAGADEICTVLNEEGYSGVDLGPVGFLGRGAELRDRLARHQLELAGGWIDLPFVDTEAFDEQLKGLNGILDVFMEAAEARLNCCRCQPSHAAGPRSGRRTPAADRNSN